VVANITEVGIGWATGGGSLFSRSLIVDGAGTPVALTVTAIDVLTVYYRCTITPDLTDSVSSVVISGITYNFTARIANAANFQSDFRFSLTSETGWGYVAGGIACTYPSTTTIGPITGVPSGSAAVGATAVRGAYTNGNFYVDNTVTWAPAQGNATGGVKGISLAFMNYGGTWQWVFTTTIPKDNTKTFVLNVRYAWGR